MSAVIIPDSMIDLTTMDSDSEPPLKRRKVSQPDTRIPPQFSTYIPLIKLSVPVEVVDDEIQKSTSFDNVSLPVSMRMVWHGGSRIALDISLAKSRNGKLYLSSETGAKSLGVLEDCAKVVSTWKSVDKPGLPLCCHHATLEKNEEGLLLQVEILWQDTVIIRDRLDPIMIEMLRRYLSVEHELSSTVPEAWQPREFYDHVHVPTKNEESSAHINIPSFDTALYPFQRRTVRWMLAREGVQTDSDGQVTSLAKPDPTCLPRGFVATKSANGKKCYVNPALGVAVSDLEVLQRVYGQVVGGLLSDEMGLGKTLGVVATACLNRRPDVTPNQRRNKLKKSGATLVITPSTILEQWRDEIQEHAPMLKLVHYDGIKGAKRNLKETVAQLAASDIVLTTYNVISREVHYVAEKPDRKMRSRPRAEPLKSPLTEISWWRVCLDEAQMVESGVSAAATVARLIPREIAWAVTGTPLRKGHRDLFGLMLFLRQEPWCHSTKLWDHLISYHRPMFRSLIGEVAIRHTKDFVREDLRLPPQSRHTITLPFTAIEQQHYEHLFGQMCEEIEVDQAGGPRHHEWDPDNPVRVEKMRVWLNRLRQTCLHPEVGARNRKALGRHAGPLRTVQQVLDVMIEQNETSMRTEQRNLLMSRIRRGQLQENAKSTDEALKLWKTAYDDACRIVDECRQQLTSEAEAQKSLKEAKAKYEDALGADEAEDDGEDGDDSTLQAFRQRLRSALEVKHICIFFIANSYFQLKSDETTVTPESEQFHALEKQETDAYDQAKAVRGELLFDVLRKANKLISSVKSKADSDSLAYIPDLKAPDDYTGIESRKIFDKFWDFVEDMNKQGKAYAELRQKMVDFLRKSLIDEDEGIELQGDEYESSTKLQDEMYSYMEALRAYFADRSDAITGQENLLIKQEMKQFLRSAREGEGPAPVLMLQLLAERAAVRIDPIKRGSLRGLVAEVRQLVTSLQWQEAGGSARARAELVIANRILDQAQTLVSTQTKALSALEQEVNAFRDTMNARLDYYRALQKISDTVAPYDEENIGNPLDERAFDQLRHSEETVSEKVASLVSKRRYLMHLKTESSSQAPRLCTICQCEFEVGTLTVCGHQFCKECIQLWWHEHRNCPICKKRLHLADFHDISYKPAEMFVQAETPSPGSASPASCSDGSLSQSIYSDISTKTLNEIKNVELPGASFGSKVDMLTRHILWLREHDPGTKCIVFSQYREFLDVLGRAFRQHQVSFSAFDDKNGIEKFKTDPAIECFLLHAKAHSAGLNLVVASHVFLCEPLLATAVELQAIARVHRIGQHRTTTVWMYIIGGTVEESIYETSVTRRLAHIKSNVKGQSKPRATSSRTSGTNTPNGTNLQENAIDLANSLELQAADLNKLLTTGKTGGEHVDKADLWQSLFGKVRKREPVMRIEDQPAGSELGKFLRAEAADARMARA